MPGLLKQLQKDKSTNRMQVESAVIRTGPTMHGEGLFREDSWDSQAVEADTSDSTDIDAFLARLSVNAAGADKRSQKTSSARQGSSKHRVIRSAPTIQGEKKAKLIMEDTPAWLSDKQKSNPQVEMLIEESRQQLEQALGEQDEVDLPREIRKAVAHAAKGIREEIRVGRRSIEEAQRVLLELLNGKGPLLPLYEDPGVSDIFIDNHKSIKVIRCGHAIETPFSFSSKEEYSLFLKGMLQSVHRSLDPRSPIVDCVLDDKWRSRVNVIDSSLLEGSEPRTCIRVPRLQKIVFYDILQTKTLPPTLAAWLTEVVLSGQTNILVVGPAGSGKTVMTTALLSAVGSDERIVTIEDVPEIYVPTIHLEKLVARPADGQGQGEVTISDLLRASLRRAPHRIVVGEIQGEEGNLFLRALETGHSGSIATVQAESAVDSLWRLLDIISSYERAPQESIMRRISRSVHLIVSIKKIDGSPCLTEVAEVQETSSGHFETRSLVTYLGKDNDKRVWQLETEHSRWIDRIAEIGMPLVTGLGLREKCLEQKS